MWKSDSGSGAGGVRYSHRAGRDKHDPQLVTHRIAHFAAANADAVALRCSAERMTYGELDARVTALAGYLRSIGVERESVVGLAHPRSFDRIVAMLAVWRAGAAFLLLDPIWPIQRLRHLLDEARAAAVIGPAAIIDRLASSSRHGVALDAKADRIARFTGRQTLETAAPNDLCYVIYTSGTSGAPKGVEITYGNLANLLAWHIPAFDLKDSDTVSHIAGVGFDGSIWEVATALSAGACLALAGDETRNSPLLLRRWLIEEKVTIAFVPTPMAELLMTMSWPASTGLRFLLTGGDTLHSFPRPDLPFTVVNNYGPAECTVIATSGVVPFHPTGGDLPTIGKPIANITIHLLDPQGMPVAPGWPGEICLGGLGVGRGYRGRPELTAERFLPDPTSAVPNARLYRTGDLGCLLPNGEIAFRRRIDDELKIRGYRIEPEGIAAALARHPGIASCAVAARETPQGENLLVAYVVPAAEACLSGEKLRAFLARSLPEYMIPTAFVGMKALPQTGNGKVDKDALPEPSLTNALGDTAFRAPATPTEIRLAAIVTEVLGASAIGVDDNFFLSGGHSLLGTTVVERAREAFCVELTLWHLFEAQTVANLAATIDKLLDAAARGNAVPRERRG